MSGDSGMLSPFGRNERTRVESSSTAASSARIFRRICVSIGVLVRQS